MAHTFHASILREYDVRGIVGETLFAADAWALGRSFATQVTRGGGSRVGVGYDGRLSSPEMRDNLIKGLTDGGVDVVSIGLGPTPLLYYSVFELDLDGGVMVTGSHNPPNYNGFKMMLGKKPCFGEAIQALGRLAAKGDWAEPAGGRVGGVEAQALLERYVARILHDFDGQAFKIAWDPANGAAGPLVEALTAQLPGQHFVINAEVDGTFPAHEADPTVEANLEQLREVVRREGCDFGLGFDGDGDRIGAVDAQGRVVWGDQLLAILAGHLLQELPGSPIIADVKASQVLFDRIAELGGQPIMWKTGHSLIKAKMTEVDAPLAGEMSGHIFFKHKFYGFDDGVYAGIRLINAVAAQGGDLAALRDALPQVVNTPELRFPCADERKFAVVDDVRARLERAGASMYTGDGVRVSTDDGWWLLRASNTQAVLVARCEASTPAGLERLKQALVDRLAESGVVPPDFI